MTGYSLGGAKGIYSYYHNADLISKAVIFNPWVGEWDSGIRFDPKDKLNPWHDQRLAELHSLNVGEGVPSWVENLYTHYNVIEGEFASKLWQSSSQFDTVRGSTPLILQCSWGVNLRYSANYPSDIVPETFADMLTSSTQTGSDHSINNWFSTGLVNVIDPMVYIKGRRIIASGKSYLFPRHSTDQHAYLWSHVDESLQLNLFTDGSVTQDDYIWEIDPLDYVGGSRIKPIGGDNTLTNLQYQFELAPGEPGGGAWYYIRAELSSASSLSLQLLGLIGNCKLLKLMINASDMCVCVWLQAQARPQPALRPGPCARPPPCAPAATAAAHWGGARRISSLNLSYFFVWVPLPLLMGLSLPAQRRKLCLPRHRSWGCSGSCNSKGGRTEPS